jgi:hypothetical protein
MRPRLDGAEAPARKALTGLRRRQGFSLFRRIADSAMSAGVPVDWSSQALAMLFLVLKQTTQRVNDLYAAGVPERRNDTYGAANVVVIVVAGLLFVLGVIGQAGQEKLRLQRSQADHNV